MIYAIKIDSVEHCVDVQKILFSLGYEWNCYYDDKFHANPSNVGYILLNSKLKSLEWISKDLSGDNFVRNKEYEVLSLRNEGKMSAIIHLEINGQRKDLSEGQKFSILNLFGHE